MQNNLKSAKHFVSYPVLQNNTTNLLNISLYIMFAGNNNKLVSTSSKLQKVILC